MKARTSEVRIVPHSNEQVFFNIVVQINNRLCRQSWKLKTVHQVYGQKLEELLDALFSAPHYLFPKA